MVQLRRYAALSLSVALLTWALAVDAGAVSVHRGFSSLPAALSSRPGSALTLPASHGEFQLRLRGGGAAVDLTEDGGISKEILVEGTGDEFPAKNDDVCVHYVGTLEADNVEFDSSRTRQAPFTFKLGQGKVIKGWDTGVATMKRGEKAVFKIRSDYAYGTEGSGDKIPGNATLIFEVELLRWNERDITADGGVFLKQLDKKGTGSPPCPSFPLKAHQNKPLPLEHGCSLPASPAKFLAGGQSTVTGLGGRTEDAAWVLGGIELLNTKPQL